MILSTVITLPILLSMLLLFTAGSWLDAERIRENWLPALAKSYDVSLYYHGLESASWSSGLSLRTLKLGVEGLSLSIQNLSIDKQTGFNIAVLDVDISSAFFVASQESDDSTAEVLALLSWMPETYHIKQFSIRTPHVDMAGSAAISLDTSALLVDMQVSGNAQVHTVENGESSPLLHARYQLSSIMSLTEQWLMVKKGLLQATGIDLKLDGLKVNDLFQDVPHIEKGHIYAQVQSSQWPMSMKKVFPTPIKAELSASLSGEQDHVVMNVTNISMLMDDTFSGQGHGLVHVNLKADQVRGKIQSFVISTWSQWAELGNDRLHMDATLDGDIIYQLQTGEAKASFYAQTDLSFEDWKINTSIQVPQLEWNGQQLAWKDVQLKSSGKYNDKAAGSLFVDMDGTSDLNNASLQWQQAIFELYPSFPFTTDAVDAMKVTLRASSLDYRHDTGLSWQMAGDVDMTAPTYVTSQALFGSQGTWHNGLLHLKTLNIDDVSNHLRSSVKGHVQVSGDILDANLSGNLHMTNMSKPLTVLMPELDVRGESHIHWQLTSDRSNNQALKLSGKVTVKDLDVSHRQFALRGLNIDLPFEQRLIWDKNQLSLLSASTFSDVMIPEVLDFSGSIAFDALEVGKEDWGHLRLGVDWYSGGVLLRPLDGDILGGSLGGETRIIFPELLHEDMLNNFEVHSRWNWVGIDSGQLIGKVSRKNHGRFNVFASMHQQQGILQGRFSVLEMGKETALNMIDWIDPKAENVNAQNAKDMMEKFGFHPAGLDATLQDRYLDMDISLRSQSGKAMHIPIRNLAITQFVVDMLEP